MIKNITAVLSIVVFTTTLFFITFLYLPKQDPLPSPYTSRPITFNPFPYTAPKIARHKSYRILIVGDSMVASLGLNAQPLRQALLSYYPNCEFVTYNYGFPSTNILSLPDRLSKTTTSQNTTYQPILSQGFDLIIIESFAYNPLSELPIIEGLKKQNEILESVVSELIINKPESYISFMTPIAPSKTSFAKNVYEISDHQRLLWVEERIAYIKNHIKFAQDTNIPLINIYEQSLNENGEANLDLINPDDNIHPSAEGVEFMAKVIAEFIYDNHIFPYN